MISKVGLVLLGLLVLFAVLPFLKHLKSKHYGVTGTFRDVINLFRGRDE